jgi:hypothetical protein
MPKIDINKKEKYIIGVTKVQTVLVNGKKYNIEKNDNKVNCFYKEPDNIDLISLKTQPNIKLEIVKIYGNIYQLNENSLDLIDTNTLILDIGYLTNTALPTIGTPSIVNSQPLFFSINYTNEILKKIFKIDIFEKYYFTKNKTSPDLQKIYSFILNVVNSKKDIIPYYLDLFFVYDNDINSFIELIKEASGKITDKIILEFYKNKFYNVDDFYNLKIDDIVTWKVMDVLNSDFIIKYNTNYNTLFLITKSQMQKELTFSGYLKPEYLFSVLLTDLFYTSFIIAPDYFFENKEYKIYL